MSPKNSLRSVFETVLPETVFGPFPIYTGMLPCVVPSWPQPMPIGISFRSRSGADHSLDFLGWSFPISFYRRASRFIEFSTKVAHFCFWRCSLRSGEGVVWRNGCPKGCYWRVRFFSALLRFALRTPETLREQGRNGLSKNTLWDNRFSARRLLRYFGAPPKVFALFA